MKTRVAVSSAAILGARRFGISGGLLSLALVIGCGDGGGDTTGAGGQGGSGTTTTTTTTTTTGGSECGDAADCPETGSACVLRACIGGVCGTVNAAEGTPIPEQMKGDCKTTVCDGGGATKSIDDDSDVANGDQQCTVNTCANGAPGSKPAGAGAACDQDGGSFCDGNGACVACVADADCGVGVCSAGACVAPTCVDGVKNGGESDVDCGGPECSPCAIGMACAAAADCAAEGFCFESACVSGAPNVLAISANGHDRFFGVTFDAQGNIYATGVSAPGTDSSTDYSTIVAKFTPQGVLDATFGVGGVATRNIVVGTNGELARGIVVQSTGKIVVGATVEHVGAADPRDRDIALVRFNADGSVDTTFGTNGVATLDLSAGEVVGNGFVADSQWGLTEYVDDRLIVTGLKKREGGTDTDFAVVRLSADGAIDNTFGTNGVASLDINQASANMRNASILADGSVIAAGYMTNPGGVVVPVMFKLDKDGKLDTGYGTQGVFSQAVLPHTTEVYAVAAQGSKLVTAGYGRSNAEESLDWLSLRVTSNGKLDASYGVNGVARVDAGGFNDNARTLTVLADGRPMLVGGGRPTANNVDGMVAVLTANGHTDSDFAPLGWKLYDLGGPADFFWGAAQAPSGKYVAVVGLKGVGANPGNDDAALVLVPTGK